MCRRKRFGNEEARKTSFSNSFATNMLDIYPALGWSLSSPFSWLVKMATKNVK